MSIRRLEPVQLAENMTERPPSDPSRIIGDYILESKLGSGAFGVVHRARHVRTGQRVAIKVLHAEGRMHAEGVLRFEREMRLLSRLQHPNVVQILETGAGEAGSYLVTELLSGASLATVLDAGRPVPAHEAHRYARQIATGLAFIHRKGVIHRDLKPSNVLLDDKHVAKIADFGMARAFDSTLLTATNAILGTPLYMAPEILSGEAPSERSDLWALGCILYHLLTGRSHFPPGRFLTPLSMEEIPPPRADSALSRLAMQLLSFQPEARPRSAAEVVEALGPPRSPPRRTPWRLVAPLALLCALAVVLRPTSRSTAPVETATASPRDERSGMFRTWRLWSSYLPELSGPDSKKRARWLNERAVLHFGARPADWTHWIRLGQWLERPVGLPPRSPAAETGLLDTVDVRITLENFSQAQTPGAARLSATYRSNLMALAVSTVTFRPEDGRGWLLLGRLLEMDEFPQGALTAYHLGLSRLEGTSLRKWPSLEWEALARALLHEPVDFLTKWPSFCRELECDESAWDGLVQGLQDTAAHRVLRAQLLDEMEQDPSFALGCLLARARMYEDEHRLDLAATVYDRALARFPGVDLVTQRARACQLTLGRVQKAPLSLGNPIDPTLMLMDQYIRGPSNRSYLERLAPGICSRTGVAQVELRRLADAGRGADAGPVLRHFLSRNKMTDLDWTTDLDLVGTGCEEPVLVELVRSQLLAGNLRDNYWRYAAGALGTGKALDLFEGTLARRARKEPISCLILQALWASRHQLLARSMNNLIEALDLAAARREYVPLEPILEVISRWCWTLHAGNPAALSRMLTPARARRIDTSQESEYLTGYFTSMLAGEQATAAERLRVAFSQAPWAVLNINWAQASAVLPSAERREALERLRASSRCLHVGSWFDHELVTLLAAP